MKKVMSRAWEIYRTLIGEHIAKLSIALRMAWKEVKKMTGTNDTNSKWESMQAMEDVVEKVETALGIIVENSPYSDNLNVYGRLWENYGKKRMYFKVYDNSNSRNVKAYDYGYVDMNTNEYVEGKFNALRRFTLAGRNAF